MVRFKRLRDNKFCVIEGQNVHIFHTGNVFIESVPLSKQYTDGMVDCPVLSLLSSNGYNELAVYSNNTIKLFEFTDEMPAISLATKGGFMCLGRRHIAMDKVVGDQLVLVYPEGFNLEGFVRGLNVKERSF